MAKPPLAHEKPLAIVCKELTPEAWPDLERLFGSNGACGGCWCQYWRVPAGERYDDIKGEEAKRRFRAQVKGDKAHGVLAYVEGEPVGWAAFDRRVALPRLDRAPSLQCGDDREQVWSLPCFFVKAKWRGRGVAAALLAAAQKALRRRGARVLEGYPNKVVSGRPRNAFDWTGVTTLFEAAGFSCVEARPKGKQRYRKTLR